MNYEKTIIDYEKAYKDLYGEVAHMLVQSRLQDRTPYFTLLEWDKLRSKFPSSG